MDILEPLKGGVLTASQIVRRGGLVVYPTETVYGLGCDPFDIDAVKRVFQVKGERRKPLPILASSINYVEKIACMTRDGKKIAQRLWPGPLTLIFSKKRVLPDEVTSSLDTVGVRVPKHDVARELIRLCGGLLIGTSANVSGEKPPRTVEEVAQELKKQVDAVIDCGSTEFGIPSTIADLSRGKLRMVRGGPVSLKELSNLG
jgi:L-threonylcarbamoyladenylate synthase